MMHREVKKDVTAALYRRRKVDLRHRLWRKHQMQSGY